MFTVECSQCRKELIRMTGGAKAIFGPGTSLACVNCGNIYLFTKENLEINEQLEHNTVEVIA